MDTLIKMPRVKPNLSRRTTAYAPKTERFLSSDAYLTDLIYSESLEFEDLMDRLRQHTGGRIPKNVRTLRDADFLSLIEEIHAGKQPSATRKEVLMAIACGNVSEDVVEDLEDAVLLQMMQEAKEEGDNELVSEEEIMKILDE